MNLRSIFATFAAFMLVAAGSGPKEAGIGSLIPQAAAVDIADHGYKPEQRGRLAMAHFSRCLFGRAPRRVSNNLQLPIGNSLATIGRLADPDCLASGELRFQFILMRGYLFGEMFRVHEAGARKKWVYPITPLDLRNVPPDSEARQVRVNFSLLTMAHCLYLRDPGSVRDIILNEPASPAQKLAYHSLIPKLGACVPKDSTFELSRSAIESAFGEYLYRSLVPVVTDVPGKPK